MRRQGTLALAAAGLALAAAAPAHADQTATQRFFSERLQADKGTSREVTDLLRTGQGFVDRTPTFRDLTGDERPDAVVRVQSGGADGAVVAREVAEGDRSVDEPLPGAEEVLDLLVRAAVGLQALGEEALRRGLLGVCRGRRSEGKTGDGEGEGRAPAHGSSRVSCADLRSPPTSSVLGAGPSLTLSA